MRGPSFIIHFEVFLGGCEVILILNLFACMYTLNFRLKVETNNMEEVRLTYFPIRGRAEIARLILVQAGVAYQDIRIKREDFLKVRYCPEGEKTTHFNPPR